MMTGCSSSGSGSARTQNPTNAVFNGQFVYMGDAVAGINVFQYDASGFLAWTGSYKPASGEAFRHIAGRNNSAGVYVILAVQATAPYSLWHFNTVTLAFTKIADPPEGALYKGLAPAPYDPAVRQPSRTAAPTPSVTASNTASISASRTMSTSNTPSRTGSITASASATLGATPSSTPSTSFSASPTIAPPISADSILLVRLCSGNEAVAMNTSAASNWNMTCGIVIEEWNFDTPTAPSLLKTIPLPTQAAGDSLPCTLPPNPGDSTGGLTLSRTGQLVSLFCWGVSPQVGLGSASFPPAQFPRVVVRIGQDNVPVQHAIQDAYSGTNQALFSAIIDDTVSPPRIYTAGTPLINGGIRFSTIGPGRRNSTSIASAGTWRSIVTDPSGTYLYAAYKATNNINTGLVRMGSTPNVWPTASYTGCNIFTACATSGNGSPQTSNPANAVWETNNRLWMGDGDLGLNLFVRSSDGTFMAFNNTFRPNPTTAFRLCTGQNNTRKEYVVYCVQALAPFTVWAYNTVTQVWTPMMSAPANTVYKGISNAPFNPAVFQVSRTSAPSTSPTASNTPSNSPTPSNRCVYLTVASLLRRPEIGSMAS